METTIKMAILLHSVGGLKEIKECIYKFQLSKYYSKKFINMMMISKKIKLDDMT